MRELVQLSGISSDPSNQLVGIGKDGTVGLLPASSVGGAVVAGSDKQVQYGSGGALAAANIWIEDANTVAKRNGSNPQADLLYNFSLDASNYERSFRRYTGNILEIGHEAAGSGVANRTVRITAYDTIQFWNSQYGYEMARIAGGIFYPGAVTPAAADSAYLGGNGGNGGNAWKSFAMAKGTTATVGAVVMNKSAGRVNIAAGTSSIVVTNDRVAATSMVLAVVSQADATAYVKNVVPAAGSFTINLGANATAQTTVDFFVIQNGA